MDDVFEKIINGELPATRVYEDAHTIAILDINPVNHGHTLIIPKKRFRTILETPDDVLTHLITTAKKVGQALIAGLGAEGFNIHINTERPAGQVIFHTHFHVIPRFRDDGIELWTQGKYKNDEEREVVGEKIRGALS